MSKVQCRNLVTNTPTKDGIRALLKATTSVNKTSQNGFKWSGLPTVVQDSVMFSMEAKENSQNWLNDCTHKDVYNNPKYVGWNEENIEEALGWFDEILNRINNGENLTPEMIKEYTNNMIYSLSDELLIDIIQNHWKLGPLYKEIS